MSFVKYIDTINDVMQNTGDVLTRLDADIQTKRQDIQRQKHSPNLTPARLAVLDEELGAAETKYRQDTAAEIKKAQKAVKDARSALEKDAADFIALNPEAVDSTTVSLMDSGVATAVDLVRFADKCGSNPTMLRLICAQAEKLAAGGDTRAQMLAAQIGVFLDPEARLNAFDIAVTNSHVGSSPEFFAVARDAWNNFVYKGVQDDMRALDSFTFEG